MVASGGIGETDSWRRLWWGQPTPIVELADLGVREVMGRRAHDPQASPLASEHREALLSFRILTALYAAARGALSLVHALDQARDVAEPGPRYVLRPAGRGRHHHCWFDAPGTKGSELMGSRAGLHHQVVKLRTWVQLPAAVLLVILALAVMHQLLPNVPESPPHLAWLGAGLARVFVVRVLLWPVQLLYGGFAAITVLLFCTTSLPWLCSVERRCTE